MKLSCSSKQSKVSAISENPKEAQLWGFLFFPIPLLSNQNSHKINRKSKRHAEITEDAGSVIAQPVQVLPVIFFPDVSSFLSIVFPLKCIRSQLLRWGSDR